MGSDWGVGKGVRMLFKQFLSQHLEGRTEVAIWFLDLCARGEAGARTLTPSPSLRYQRA